MKLKELQTLIYDDLIIVTKTGTYKDVYKYGPVFNGLKNSEVIGIRSEDTYIVISVR